jgi:hypothetical protein
MFELYVDPVTVVNGHFASAGVDEHYDAEQ